MVGSGDHDAAERRAAIFESEQSWWGLLSNPADVVGFMVPHEDRCGVLWAFGVRVDFHPI